MWEQEAQWLSRAVYGMDPKLVFPMLDVGSGSEETRMVMEPWIDRYLFAPARAGEFEVVHTDVWEGPGVDIAGDLTDEAFVAKLRGMRFRSVLCANVLEHVADLERVCEALESIPRPGGLLFVSVPYRLNYHPCPIDTGFRPLPADLARLFGNCDVLRSEIIFCGREIWKLARAPVSLLRRALRLCLPFYRPRRWSRLLWYRGWTTFTNAKQSIVVLRKAGAARH